MIPFLRMTLALFDITGTSGILRNRRGWSWAEARMADNIQRQRRNLPTEKFSGRKMRTNERTPNEEQTGSSAKTGMPELTGAVEIRANRRTPDSVEAEPMTGSRTPASYKSKSIKANQSKSKGKRDKEAGHRAPDLRKSKLIKAKQSKTKQKEKTGAQTTRWLQTHEPLQEIRNPKPRNPKEGRNPNSESVQGFHARNFSGKSLPVWRGEGVAKANRAIANLSWYKTVEPLINLVTLR
jgi:hypothetical protein